MASESSYDAPVASAALLPSEVIMLAPLDTLAHHYTIVRLLGQGGFGAVYLARDDRLRREVAIKQTRSPDDPRVVAQRESEAELLANVDHPALPRVYHSFVEDGYHYLVLQYIPGEHLGEYLSHHPGGRLDPDAALRLLRPLLDALAYLHAQNPPIVHRDLTPGNVRLTPGGQVYLVDFGIAKAYRPDTRTDTFARAVTAGFSSFEQYGGGATDARADLYSFGALFYWMLTGIIPPDAPQRVKSDPLIPVAQITSAVPPPLAATIQRLLAVWPDDRYADVAELRADLFPDEVPLSSPDEPTYVQASPASPIHEVSVAFVRPTVAPVRPPLDRDALLARLQPDVIVRGPMFHERVQLIELKQVGTLYRLRGEGLESGIVHRPMLREEQLRDLIVEETGRFDGDPLRFRLGVEALRLGIAYEYDRFFSLSIARVDPLPHQLEAVYEHFLTQPRIRFLLADDPGAGKTIMAGLLIKELKIRRLAQRILIVTPANLTFQWQRELKDKFRDQFEVVRGDVLRQTYGSNPWQEKHQVITSISWVSRMDDARQSLLRAQWDLVIVDEAHKMSAYSDDHKTLAYQLGEELSRLTDHLLLMTATPHKGDAENFCRFLRVLDADVYGDVSSLEEAVRRQQAPFYLRRVKEAMVTFPDPVTGQVRRLFTKRQVQTIEFTLDADEWDFYDALTRYVEEQSVQAAAEPSALGRAVGFTMAMLQRRFASSMYAVRRSLERMKERREKILADPEAHRHEQINRRVPDTFDELPDAEQQAIIDELEQAVASVDPAALQREIGQLGRLIVQAHGLESREIESKLVKLRDVLVAQGIFSDPTMKLLLFTEHRETLDYLVEKLVAWGLSVTQISGGMKIGDRDTPGTRIYAERAFKEQCQVLVATEAAGEGINLQFCWLMINYDIPWNPVRLEQRMGRIHRYGQEKDCLIFNFVATNTAEGRVLFKLFERIREIERDLDPNGTGTVFNVLGDIFPANQLERMLRDMYAHNLTEEVITSRIVEQVDRERFERITYSALEGLAKRDLNLAGLLSASAEAKERRLVPDVVRDFFLQAAPVVGLPVRPLTPAAARLPLSQRERGQGGEGRKLYRVGRIPPSMTTQGERHESRFGRLGQEYGPITFDQDMLTADPTLEWVTPGHPLFEALREDVLDQAQADFRRGAIFFELQRSMPARLDLFAATMSDGREHVLERRIMVVETRLDATQIVRQPTLFLDLVPAPEGTAAPTGVGLPDTDSAVQVLTEQDLQVLLGDLQATRAHEIDRVAEHTAISLNALIHRQSMRMAELFAQQDASTENPLVAANLKQTSDRLELLNTRLERRQAELAQERYVTISQVRHLAQAWVLPHPERASALLAPLISDVDVERVAVREVTRTLTAAGWNVESVETQNRGFDLIARLREPHPPNAARAVRYIEVKGRSALGDVALTNNEYKTAERLGEDYWLYVVYHCATQPEIHAVRDPARLPWAEVLQVAHYRVGVRQILAQQEG